MDRTTSYDQLPTDREKGPTVLIVDDEMAGRARLELLLTGTEDLRDLIILNAASLEEALKVISTQTVHVVLLDKNLGPAEAESSANGIAAIPALLQLNPHLQILVITGSNSTQDVVAAMKNGAFGYITKDKPDELLTCQIKQAVKMARLSLFKTIQDCVAPCKPSPSTFELPGSSLAIRRVVSQIQVVSETNRSVLLLGETGVGKTTVAEAIHAYRKEFLKQKVRHFIPVNLAALPKELIERELFGNDAGAFTGALRMKQGFVELANNGTLFLDEIGECPLDVQTKLLTVLNKGKFFRVGGQTEMQSSFKLICATNRDLEAMVKAGTFREDLYMRISTFQIKIPSLQERPEDVPEIAKAIFGRVCTENNVEMTFEELPSELIQYLMENPPPGNIRGIDNILSRLLVWSPRLRNGRPNLAQWRATLGFSKQNLHKPARSAISARELLTLPIDISCPEFPGLTQLLSNVAEKILLDTKERFHTNREVAKRLKISEGMVSVKLKEANQKIASSQVDLQQRAEVTQ